jgi:hypothetical protein
MEILINIQLINSEFNPEIAKDFYQGQESEDNVRTIWEDEFKLQGVDQHSIQHKEPYVLKGLFADNSPFEFEIDKVSKIICQHSDGKISEFAFSKKLVKKINKKNISDKKILIEVELNDELPLENPIDGVYILASDFPKALKSSD